MNAQSPFQGDEIAPSLQIPFGIHHIVWCQPLLAYIFMFRGTNSCTHKSSYVAVSTPPCVHCDTVRCQILSSSTIYCAVIIPPCIHRDVGCQSLLREAVISCSTELLAEAVISCSTNSSVRVFFFLVVQSPLCMPIYSLRCERGVIFHGQWCRGTQSPPLKFYSFGCSSHDIDYSSSDVDCCSPDVYLLPMIFILPLIEMMCGISGTSF